MSELTRRGLLQAAGAMGAIGAMGVGLSASSAAPATEGAAAGGDKPVKFRLGIVTYQIAADWDLPTMLKVCRNVGLSPVELRTTHKHGVEPSLAKEQRQEVKKRFADAGVEVWGCGTTCEFHSLDA